jgi:hypothetical protein
MVIYMNKQNLELHILHQFYTNIPTMYIITYIFYCAKMILMMEKLSQSRPPCSSIHYSLLVTLRSLCGHSAAVSPSAWPAMHLPVLRPLLRIEVPGDAVPHVH